MMNNKTDDDTANSYVLLFIPDYEKEDEPVLPFEKTKYDGTTLKDLKTPGTYWFKGETELFEPVEAFDMTDKTWRELKFKRSDSVPGLKTGDKVTVIVAIGSKKHKEHEGKFENLKIAIGPGGKKPLWENCWSDIRVFDDEGNTNRQIQENLQQTWYYSRVNSAEPKEGQMFSPYEEFNNAVKFRHKCSFILEKINETGEMEIYVKFGDPHEGNNKIKCE